jgi:hypothetical protein
MNGLRKMMALPWRDRILLLEAWVALTAMRAAVYVASVDTLRNATRALARRASASPRATPERIGWAVVAASRLVPRGDNCLVRALAAEALLRRLGYDSELEFGARKTDDGRLEAHAWLTSGDRIVVGGLEKESYTAMSRGGGESSRRVTR